MEKKTKTKVPKRVKIFFIFIGLLFLGALVAGIIGAALDDGKPSVKEPTESQGATQISLAGQLTESRRELDRVYIVIQELIDDTDKVYSYAFMLQDGKVSASAIAHYGQFLQIVGEFNRSRDFWSAEIESKTTVYETLVPTMAAVSDAQKFLDGRLAPVSAALYVSIEPYLD